MCAHIPQFTFGLTLMCYLWIVLRLVCHLKSGWFSRIIAGNVAGNITFFYFHLTKNVTACIFFLFWITNFFFFKILEIMIQAAILTVVSAYSLWAHSFLQNRGTWQYLLLLTLGFLQRSAVGSRQVLRCDYYLPGKTCSLPQPLFFHLLTSLTVVSGYNPGLQTPLGTWIFLYCMLLEDLTERVQWGQMFFSALLLHDHQNLTNYGTTLWLHPWPCSSFFL